MGNSVDGVENLGGCVCVILMHASWQSRNAIVWHIDGVTKQRKCTGQSLFDVPELCGAITLASSPARCVLGPCNVNVALVECAGVNVDREKVLGVGSGGAYGQWAESSGWHIVKWGGTLVLALCRTSVLRITSLKG